MLNLALIKPHLGFETEYLNMIADWKAYDPEHIPWFINLDTGDFKTMVQKLEELSRGIGVEEPFVTSSTFWLSDNTRKIIGAINIRHQLTDFYLNYGGQVGYGIRPSERNKGYAKEILRMGLEICEDMGFEKVLLCCAKDNLGSVKTLIANGGVLDSEAVVNGELIQRYWIKIA